jgi:hypothetical protein
VAAAWQTGTVLPSNTVVLLATGSAKISLVRNALSSASLLLLGKAAVCGFPGRAAGILMFRAPDNKFLRFYGKCMQEFTCACCRSKE